MSPRRSKRLRAAAASTELEAGPNAAKRVKTSHAAAAKSMAATAKGVKPKSTASRSATSKSVASGSATAKSATRKRGATSKGKGRTSLAFATEPQQQLATGSSTTTSTGSKVPPRPFLSLPFEVRNHILGYLLKRDEPLFFHSTAEDPIGARSSADDSLERILWPEILCTCKQLRDEGEAILYTNTIGARVGDATPTEDPEDEEDLGENPVTPKLLGRRYRLHLPVPGNLPTSISRFTRIDLQITARKNLSADIDNRVAIRDAVRYLAREINVHSTWRHISIRINGTDFVNPGTDDGGPVVDYPAHRTPGHLSTFVLQPLASLRDRTAVSCSGTGDVIKQKLAQNLVRRGPAYLLDDLLEVVQAYCSPILNNETGRALGAVISSEATLVDRCRERLHRGVIPAAQSENVKHFVQQRQILMSMLALLNAFRSAIVYAEDPEISGSHALSMRGAASVIDGFRPEADVKSTRFDDIHARMLELQEKPFDRVLDDNMTIWIYEGTRRKHVKWYTP